MSRDSFGTLLHFIGRKAFMKRWEIICQMDQIITSNHHHWHIYMKNWSDSNRTICLRKSPQLHWCKTLKQTMYNLTWFFVFKFFLHKWINSICMEVKTILMFPKNIWESLPHTPMLAKKGVKFPFHTHTHRQKKILKY